MTSRTKASRIAALIALTVVCACKHAEDAAPDGAVHGEDGAVADAGRDGSTSDAGNEPEQEDPYLASLTPEQLARNAYLRSRIEVYKQTSEAPAIAAALVMGNEIAAAAVVGVRRVDSPEPARLDDYFMLKSCTKPMTGYLAARVMQLEPRLAPDSAKTFSWSTTILDVFPELAPLTHAAYVNTTVAELMAHASRMPISPRMEGNDEFADITSDLRERRFEYVKAAIQDEPEDPSPYSGGSIIVAAMLERILDRSWEDLMRQYVFDELGMNNAGVGEAPYPPSTRATTSHDPSANGPVPWTPPEDYAEEVHAPAGRNPHASVLDTARFVAAQMRDGSDRPGQLELSHLIASHTFAAGQYSQGGWIQGGTLGETDEMLQHAGTDGADYALIELYPPLGVGLVMMANYQDTNIGALKPELRLISEYFEMTGHFDAEAAAPKTATATNVYGDEAQYDADKAVDGLLDTRWATGGVSTASITVQLGTTRTVSELIVAEPPQYPRVRAFVVSAETEDGWQEVATGTNIGAGRAIPFDEPVSASAVRLEITDSTGEPTIAEIWVK